MKNKLLLSFGMALIVLCSCANLCDYNDFYRVSKKTTQTEFLSTHEENIKETFELIVNNEKYTVYMVNIITLMVSREIAEPKKSEYLYPKDGTPAGRTLYDRPKYYMKNKGSSNKYCFAFKNNHYFYSGFLFEYLRNTDSSTKALGEEIYDYLFLVKGDK